MSKNTAINDISQEPVDKWQQFRLKSKIDLTKRDPVPPVCLSIIEGDKTSIVGTLGNISLILGMAKARKSYVVSSIAAAFLTGKEFLNFTGSLPEGKNKVIYADTEQGNYHTRKIFERILRMAGLPVDKETERIEFLRLRSFGHTDIADFLEHTIYNTDNVGVLIIDGVRDMVKDINSSEEGSKIARLLMRWSDERQIHILTVLHQNKGDGNARGHIGSEFSNKAESIIKVEKNNTEKEKSIISSHMLRDVDFEPFTFTIDENDFPAVIENSSYYSLKKSDPKVHDDDFHKNVLSIIFKINGSEFSKREFNIKLRAELPDKFSISEKLARNWIAYYEEKGFIKNSGSEKSAKLISNLVYE